MALSISLLLLVGLLLIFIIGALVAMFLLNRRGDMPTRIDGTQQPASGRAAFVNIADDPEVHRLLAEGNKIAAIKHVREQTSLGLKEAKDYVDGLASRDGAARPATAGPLGHATPEVEQMARSLLTEGKKIQAVKYVREQTGWGLKEAKEFVDTL